MSDDQDYACPFNKEKFSTFLGMEWKNRKRSEIHFYKRLSQFFEKHYPQIKYASDLELSLLVRSLAESGSFAATHTAIRDLTPLMPSLTEEQVETLFDAAFHNLQIYRILTDDNIDKFFNELVRLYGKRVNKQKVALIDSHLKMKPYWSLMIGQGEKELPSS